jgi:hypothetical protein
MSDSQLPEGLNRVPVRDSEWPIYWIVDADLNVVGQTGRNGVDAYFVMTDEPASGQGTTAGNFTPTTDPTGATVEDVGSARYIRVGDHVTVSGTLELKAAAEYISVVMSLPIASGVTSSNELAGTAAVFVPDGEAEGEGSYGGGTVVGDDGGAKVTIKVSDAEALAESAVYVTFTYAYDIVPEPEPEEE